MVGGGARESSARREGVQGRTSRTFGPSNIIGYDRTPTRASSVAHAPQCALIFCFFYWRRPACVLNLRTRRRPTEVGCPCGARPIRPLRRDGSRVSRAAHFVLYETRAQVDASQRKENSDPSPASRRAPVRSRWADDALARLPPGEDREAYRAKQGGRSCRVRRVVSLLCHLGCSRPCSRTSRDE